MTIGGEASCTEKLVFSLKTMLSKSSKGLCVICRTLLVDHARINSIYIEILPAKLKPVINSHHLQALHLTELLLLQLVHTLIQLLALCRTTTLLLQQCTSPHHPPEDTPRLHHQVRLYMQPNLLFKANQRPKTVKVKSSQRNSGHKLPQALLGVLVCQVSKQRVL